MGRRGRLSGRNGVGRSDPAASSTGSPTSSRGRFLIPAGSRCRRSQRHQRVIIDDEGESEGMARPTVAGNAYRWASPAIERMIRNRPAIALDLLQADTATRHFVALAVRGWE